MMEIYGTVLILIKVKAGEEILPYIIFLLILISMVTFLRLLYIFMLLGIHAGYIYGRYKKYNSVNNCMLFKIIIFL